MTLTHLNGDARSAVFRLLDADPGLNRHQLSERLGGSPGPRQCATYRAQWKSERTAGGTATAAPAATPVAVEPPARKAATTATPRRRPPAMKMADGSDDRLERWGRLAVCWGCAAIALVMSYSHVRHLAIRAGVGWPELLPLSIDGLMLAGWLCLRRHPRYPLAVLAVALGVAGSAALNAIAARPELVAMADVRLGAALAVPISAVVAMHLALRR